MRLSGRKRAREHLETDHDAALHLTLGEGVGHRHCGDLSQNHLFAIVGGARKVVNMVRAGAGTGVAVW